MNIRSRSRGREKLKKFPPEEYDRKIKIKKFGGSLNQLEERVV